MAVNSTVLITLVLLIGAAVPSFAEEEPKQTFTCTAKTFNECLMEAPCRRPPVGVETVEVYPLGGRERPTAFWWHATPQKNMVHGLLRT